jgi:histidinol phosphatase-like enzyme (inositol monophosphatase family)
MRGDLELALALADEADAVSLPRFRALDLRVETKPDLTPVTDADRTVERDLRAQIAAERPGEAVFGEEEGGGDDSDVRWVIDPIDGTRNFSRGIPVWATLIALERAGVTVVGVASAPALGRRWWAVRGGGAFADGAAISVSRVGRLDEASVSANLSCAGLRRARHLRDFGDFWQHVLVAEGSLDAGVDPVMRYWDVVAVRLIVEEAGGRATDVAGARSTDSLVTSNGLLHDEVLAAFAGEGDRVAARVARGAGAPELVEVLADLPPTDLQSLLLAVARRRAGGLRVADVLARYGENRLTRPSRADPARLLELHRLAFSLLPPGFERVELSPVAPLGTSSVLGGISQDRVLATTRNTEVVSDSTNVLALECALRRRRARDSDVKLCAEHRLLRTEALPPGDGLSPHFGLLGLCSATRDRGSFRTEAETLLEHVDFHVRLLEVAGELGVDAGEIAVAFSDLAEGRWLASLESDVLAPLRADHGDVSFTATAEDASAGGYYERVRFRIHVGGERVFLVDGGFTDWTQRLLSDRKERLLISGLGTERLLALFGGA